MRENVSILLVVIQLAISKHVSSISDVEYLACVHPWRLKSFHPDPQVVFVGPLRLVLLLADGYLKNGLGCKTVLAYLQRRLHIGVHFDALHLLQVATDAHTAELVFVEKHV